MSGEKPSIPDLCLSNDDETVKVVTISGTREDPSAHYKEIVDSLHKYEWKKDDFLLAAFPKNGQ